MQVLTDLCKNLTLNSEFAGVFTESLNLKTEAVDYGVHRFSLVYDSIDPSVDYVDLNVKNLRQRDVFVELNSLGYSNTFTWALPIHKIRYGVGGGTPQADPTGISIPAGSTSFKIKNATPSVTGWLRKGDIFRWANHTKLYMVAADVNTDISGDATVTTINPLRISQMDGNDMLIDNIEATLRVKPQGNKTTYEYGRVAGDQDMMAFSLEFIEAL